MVYCFQPSVLLLLIRYVRVISTDKVDMAHQGKQFTIIEEMRLFNNTILFEDVQKKKAQVLSTHS